MSLSLSYFLIYPLFLLSQSEKLGGTLMEQLAKIEPVLKDLRQRRDQRIDEFRAVQQQIAHLQAEISGTIDPGEPAPPLVDDSDLSLKWLGELKVQLNELQMEKVAHSPKICFSLLEVSC
jgi:Ase1/PRC1/MAP65 family protein